MAHYEHTAHTYHHLYWHTAFEYMIKEMYIKQIWVCKRLVGIR